MAVTVAEVAQLVKVLQENYETTFDPSRIRYTKSYSEVFDTLWPEGHPARELVLFLCYSGEGVDVIASVANI